jgi:hypothetical protein
MGIERPLFEELDADSRATAARRARTRDVDVPGVTESVEEHRGSFTIQPLDRGFGYTFGNSLRRGCC